MRKLLAGLGETAQWTPGARCMLAATISLFVDCWYVAIGAYLLGNPTVGAYADRDVIRGFLIPLWGGTMLLAWLAILAGAWTSVRRHTSARLLQHLTTQVYSLGHAVLSHLLGIFTSGFGVAVLLVGVAYGTLLLDRLPVLLGVGSFLAVVSATTVAEQLGWLSYSPLLREPPFSDGHLATSWLAGIGGATAVLAVCVFALIDILVDRRRAQRESLARTERALVRATEELTCANRDLSDAGENLRSAQARLVQAEKMASLGELFAGAAHELNNPASFLHAGFENLTEYLDSFAGVIHRLEGVPLADPASRAAIGRARSRLGIDELLNDAPELLRICAEGADRIRSIVDDLRGFARPDTGERLLVDVCGGIDSTLRLLGDRLQRQSIAVRKHYESAPSVVGNPAHLGQVWMNLLANAVDAVEPTPAPEIVVSVRQRDAVVEVDIRDNGTGISPDALPRVFEPFFTTKPSGRGTGLGLSIVYEVIRDHAGDITVESEPLRGTRVVVQLPAAPTRAVS